MELPLLAENQQYMGILRNIVENYAPPLADTVKYCQFLQDMTAFTLIVVEHGQKYERYLQQQIKENR